MDYYLRESQMKETEYGPNGNLFYHNYSGNSNITLVIEAKRSLDDRVIEKTLDKEDLKDMLKLIEEGEEYGTQ